MPTNTGTSLDALKSLDILYLDVKSADGTIPVQNLWKTFRKYQLCCRSINTLSDPDPRIHNPELLIPIQVS